MNGTTRISLASLTPRPCNLPSAEITALGEKVRRRLAIQSLEGLEGGISGIGGEVRRTHSFLHSLVVLGDERFVIFVHEAEGTFRSRELVATGLGHYFLHYPLLDSEVMLVPNGFSEPAYAEARAFANAFLMPEALMREEFARLRGIGVDIARDLGLDTSIVFPRLRELDLMG